MNANAIPLLALFETKLRLEVPLFQRQYVWSKEHQWEPLWEDIERKFVEYLDGRKDAPVHFLGAMVLDQKQTPTGHVSKRQVIDGQQRMTTLQLFLAAFRDFCNVNECKKVGEECIRFTRNEGLMADPETEKFKVWPTLADRTQFKDVLESESREELEKRHPLIRRKHKKLYDPRPRMVEAYLYFYEALTEFFIGTEELPPLYAEFPLCARLEESFQALKNALQVVVVDLDQGDDAQVIFETLNARGEPLLPADLLRNYIFLRAARFNEDPEKLYGKYWTRFDDPFWREEVRQGRLNRPRSDLFMQHFLASRQANDIPIKHLFVEYKFWIERKKPFETVEKELETLAKQGDDFRRLLEPDKEDPVGRIGRFLQTFDMSTAYPLLLWLMSQNVSDEEWTRISEVLESYVVRRAVCGRTTKNYNRIFLGLLRHLQKEQTPTANAIATFLLSQKGDSVDWPDDATFAEAWKTGHAYGIGNSRVSYILLRLSDTYLGKKHEWIEVQGALTLEHILPQSWIEHWLLPDGSKGLVSEALMTEHPDHPSVIQTRRRNALVHTFGNLTILSPGANFGNSNDPWSKKKPAMMKWSLLPINQVLHEYEDWNEEAIEKRGEDLLNRAIDLWPRT